MTVTALDPNNAHGFTLARASSSTTFGVVELLDVVPPGLYEARSTGPVMVCNGKTAREGGVLVTPEAPARILVKRNAKLCAAAMSGSCTLVLIAVVVLEPAELVQGSLEAFVPSAGRC